MNIMELGAIGEMIGAIAVVGSAACPTITTTTTSRKSRRTFSTASWPTKRFDETTTSMGRVMRHFRVQSCVNRVLITAIGLAFYATPGAAADGESGKELDAAALYAENCVACHGRAAFSPSLPRLANMTAEEIHKELWFGVMAQFANGMDDAQRWAVSKWIADQKPDKDTRESGVPLCEKRTALRPNPEHDWPGLSNDSRFSRHVRNASLTEAQVKGMRVKWAVAFPQVHAYKGAGSPVSVVGDRLFVGNLNQWVYSLDADSGCAQWAFRAEWRVRSNVAVSDGVAVFGDLGANIYALDAETGRLLWRDKADWTPTSRITGNLTAHGGVVYAPVSSLQEVLNLAKSKEYPCCTFRGSVVAYDLHSGKRRWKSYTIDQEVQYLGKTKKGTNRYGPSGVVVFSGITVDDKRQLVYVPTGNQMTEPFVKESDAVLALDMKTGKKRWVTSLAPEQMGGQDIYHLGCEAWVDPERSTCSPENPTGHGDRDFVSPAVLTKGAGGKEVILAGSKDGMLYGLDPDAGGKVLWQIRVGRGGEVGGIEWGFSSDGKNAYVPVTDMDADMKAKGSFTAVDIQTGKSVWRVDDLSPDCDGKSTPPCSNAFTLPSTVVGGFVFTGTNDGVLRAYNTATGEEVWTFDTVRDYETVNDRRGFGGSLAAYGGPVFVGNRMYLFSGMDQFNVGLPGNVLLAFEIPE
jgi:polyvinyl alcohol dehydrogenase (cytochrome)